MLLRYDPRVHIFAATVATNPGDDMQPAQPLYDTLADHTPATTRLVLGK